MKLIVSLLVQIVLGFSAVQMRAADSHVEFGTVYTYLGYRINDMPLSVRNVPVHPDDSGYQSNQGPIERRQFDADHSVSIGLSYLLEWEGRLRYRVGFGLNWFLYPHELVYDNAERNYSSAVGTSQRGEGAALTFVGLEQRGVVPPFDAIGDYFLNWTPEVRFEVAPREGRFRNFFVGASLSYFNVRAVNGWDRFDRLELRDSKVLSHHIPLRMYLGWNPGKGPFKWLIGAQIQPAIKTSLGKEANIDAPPVTVFTALGLEL